MSYIGDASMLLCPMTSFLCSHRVPDGVSVAIHKWVLGLDGTNSCVICGNLSATERFTLGMLVERGIPVVLVLAHSIPSTLSELKLTATEKNALDEGRLVIISPILDETITTASGKSSAARNRLMIDLSTQIVVGFMSENGNLASQLLGKRNVTILQDSGQEQVQETDVQKLQHQATQMGWSIYRRLGEVLVSLEMRQLLLQYLKLEGIQRPSMLHSLVLFRVVKQYSGLVDFDFTAFLRMWGVENLRPEDWKSTKVNGKWMPSLAERVMVRLFKQLPGKYNQLVNPNEQFDAQMAHSLLDVALNRTSKPNAILLKRALRLAYAEHDKEGINRYTALLGKR